ncbi:MAG TPA: D-alanyl-D-alanine carboxypeptidase/D-alanyl-D-alanine-endopeptidase [Verrucomicrobiae bacterium]|jgi:D-alanyl-D-alanine carboxypeptidase/D-alanyl-D-alanine-endopeptidase (penicillin-binding protein 4)|nr:D-alanyl-D-alanine carboxypeptidase/D-alanyl-D-alanine-endopeptidase [Verrucomicrobiae bacterium]
MFRLRYFAATFLWLTLLVPAYGSGNKRQSSAAKLTHDIQDIVDDQDSARGFWGIEAVSLDSGRTLVSLNQDKLFTPASNAKLFTTAAVFGLIGPDYRFKTTVETMGTLDKYGRLDADLIVVGRGDPNLSGRTLPYNMRTERRAPPIQVLQDLADELVQHGLKYVDGDIVADDSYFVWERYGEGWSQDDLAREWGAPVSALTINDNVIFVNIMPADRPGERAFLNITPFPEYYKIDNRVVTTPAGSEPRTVSINREPGSNLLTFWGNIPQGDPGFGEALAIEDPADFIARLFRQLLEERGVTVYGHARTHHTELASMQTFSITSMASGGGNSMRPPTPTPMVLASYQSQPVGEDLRVINKVSQNLHAELMLRLLGKEKGNSGSIAGGLEVLRSFLVNAGIKPDEFVFLDGSGLSREDLVTPEAVVALLQYCHKQPWGTAFVDTLPVAATDGSLSDRFRNTPAAGVVHAKTGSLSHVYSLSGFATTKSGDHIVFSVMTNNNNMATKKALDTIDAVVVRMMDDAK